MLGKERYAGIGERFETVAWQAATTTGPATLDNEQRTASSMVYKHIIVN